MVQLKINLIFATCLLLFPISTFALDTVKVIRTQSFLSPHSEFKDVLLKRVLNITSEQYGPFKYVMNRMDMNRARALANIIKGDSHNVYISPSSETWNQQAIAIKIPIRLGLLSYRLLLIHKDDLSLFSNVTTLSQLKKLTAGLRSKWQTTRIFANQGFNVFESEDYKRLFLLLDSHKFQYFPRTIYEIYDEMEQRTDLYKNILIEPTIALEIPMATYVYVSPETPLLAKRIEDGLKRLHLSGELAVIVEKYYGEAIKRSKIKQRNIIKIENPYYPMEDQIDDRQYWYRF